MASTYLTPPEAAPSLRPSPSQRLYQSLMAGALLAVWSAALSGWQIQRWPNLLLALHLASAIGGLLVIAAFLQRHWWQRREGLWRHANARWGLAALVALLLLTVSGAALLRWTNLPWLQRLHSVAALLILGVLTIHIAWRVRRRLAQSLHARRIAMPALIRSRAFSGSSALRRWLLSGLLVGLLLLPAAGVGAFAIERARPGQAIPLAHASLPAGSLPTAGACAACHADLSAQWRSSTHAQAASDPYYTSLAAMFTQERGVEALRYCVACHAPLGLMRGEVRRAPAAGEQTAAEAPAEAPAAQAYAARALGVELALSPPAAEGVSCAICHLARSASAAQNAALAFEAGASLPGAGLTRLALRSAPDDHRRQVRRATLEEAALCGACHNLRSPDGLLLEPTFQEWLDSPYPGLGQTCQSCHFPSTPARLADSSPLAPTAAHGGFPGAPSSLPGVALGADLLRQAAELNLQATLAGGELLATVTLTNSGAGHFLPTGADDLRQVWLQVSLFDPAGNLVWQSGGLDEYGELAQDAVRFRKVLGDSNGRPIELHRFWVATQILADTRLAPLEARRLEYRLPQPPAEAGPYRLVARLLYQDVSATFAAFALEKPVIDLPVIEMAAQELEINSLNLNLVR